MELEKNSQKLEKRTTKNNLGVDAVSRQAINGYIDYIQNHGMGKKKSFDFIKKFVANLPPVTPIRPKGHWLGDSAGYKCNICGHDLLEIAHSIDYIDFKKSNYCPNCGADMREVVEE